MLFRVFHEIIDALGLAQLLNHFVEAMSGVRDVIFGDEGKNLAPAFSVALNLEPPKETHLIRAHDGRAGGC
jgi:hypothetical protein